MINNINKFLQWFYKLGKKQIVDSFYQMRKNLLADEALVVIDIGAANGLLPHWQKFKHFAEVYCIEPDQRSAEALKKLYHDFPNITIIEKGVGAASGKQKLYLTHVPTGSSLLKPNVDYLYMVKGYFDPYTTKDIPVYSLDSIITNEINQPIHALKIDIQGYEYHMLTGISDKTFDSICCIELEAGLPGTYVKQPRFSQIDELLIKKEFELYDIRIARGYLPNNLINKDLTRHKIMDNSPKIGARVHEVDVVYFRKFDTILNIQDKLLIQKMIILLCSYNFFLEATYLIEQSHAKTIHSKEEMQLIRKFIWQWYEILEEEPLYSDYILSNWIRKILFRFQLKDSPRWYGYMTQRYPN